jgi:hypothetical protein
MSSVAQQVRDSLKDAGGALSMAQLTDANGWDAAEKASAYTAIASLRKQGLVETVVEDGTPCHRLIDGNSKPKAKPPTAKKAKLQKIQDAANAAPAAPAPQISEAPVGARVKRAYTRRTELASLAPAKPPAAPVAVDYGVRQMTPDRSISDRSLRLLIASSLISASSPLGSGLKDALIEAVNKIA